MRLTAGYAKSGDCHEGAPALNNDGHWWCRPLAVLQRAISGISSYEIQRIGQLVGAVPPAIR